MAIQTRLRAAPDRAGQRWLFFCRKSRALLHVCLAVLLACGVAAGQAQENVPEETIFTLAPVSEGLCVTVPIDLAEHEVNFKKTPAFQNPVTCGAIPLNESVSEYVGFAWDETARRLYVDANRNLDLTDDTDAVYDAGSELGTFENVRFSVQRGEFTIPYVVDVRLFEDWLRMVVVRSGWKGRIEVNGAPFEIALADNLDGSLAPSDLFRVMAGVAQKPTEEPDYISMYYSRENHGVPKYVALAGSTLAVQTEFVTADGAVAVQLRLSKPASPMGEIKLAGKNIEELVLLGDGAMYAFPAGDTLLAPLGRAQVDRVIMTDGWTMEVADSKPSVYVTREAPAVLTAGGPLTQKVEVMRSGNTLLLTHAVQGIGKEGYTNSKRYESPPQFTVYRGDTVVATGTFEYG